MQLPMQLSFEVFTPRSAQGVKQLCEGGRVAAYASLGPSFMGVSGQDGSGTLALLEHIKNAHCIRPQIHLPRAELTEDAVASFVDRAMNIGVVDVLVLGGAPGTMRAAANGSFGSATELVVFLKKRYGGRLRIAVCGYPQGTRGEAADRAADLAQTVQQVAAGAECVVSMPTFDAPSHAAYVAEARAAGVSETVALLPGILPMCELGEMQRLCRALHVTLPTSVEQQLRAATNDAAVTAARRSSLATQTRELRAAGACGAHVYTLNAAELVADLAEAGYQPLKHRLP